MNMQKSLSNKKSWMLIPAVAMALGFTSGLNAEEEILLEPELPKPLFVGTAKPIKIPNLRSIEESEPTKIMMPKSAKNLAKGKTVTSSDDFPVIGELEFITDGDKDGADGYFVELGPGTQWVQIDLGKPATLYGIVVWHYHANARAYKDVVVQVADDAEFTKNVRTLFNNDDDNSSGLGAGKEQAYVDTYQGEIIDAKKEKAQYVRCYSAGNTANAMNHYIEVEVYGTE